MYEIDSAATLRQKKAALLEVIELQRKLIESHDANVSEVPSDAPGDSGSDRELEWHTEQAKRLDKFKAALHATRLQPDEFLLLVSAEWASGGSGGGARRPRELVPYLLRVNARSQLTFVPHQPVVGGAVAGKLEPELSGNGTNSSDDVLAGAARPRVFFMDMLKHVKLAADDSRTLQCPDKAVSLLSAAAPSSVREVVLEWRSRQPPLFCLTHEGSELVEVLGAHLRRYNSSRVTQVQGLKNIHRLKCTTFAASNTAHAELLRRLWICGFGSEQGFAPVSERWVHLGFQSADPTTDLRGMGLLGLENLVYFGEHYTDVFQRLVAAQKKRDYPLACAGINVTSMLLELLRMRDETATECQKRPPFDTEWDSEMFHFFCHMFYRERPFEDMYCFSVRMLDRMFVSMEAEYSDFNMVLAALRGRLQEALVQRPLSFREFKRLISAPGGDNDSVHSGATSNSGYSYSGGGGSAGQPNSVSGERELSRVIADALGGLPQSLDTVKSRLDSGLHALATFFPPKSR
uniref:ELMO domain-containing protein n=1 Tax=Haptolina ericina TaxID=156174 RepID=A0A7S3ETY4_9EUKA|mmetsp:Transcript_23120/g.52460  ORF Transcript_23120/g.52460 Transcript_23120/m.52460 type:complete len:519 (+) Transcript_23120:105-1661(+)